MKEETDLKQKIGKDNPFKVPEGYFENLTGQIMDKLPEIDNTKEEKEISLWEKIKPWVYMTAMFCGMMFGLKVMMGDKALESQNGTEDISIASSDNATQEDDSDIIPDEYIDPIVDQVMMDDYTLYMYLTDADMEIYED
ncbi:MAG: hypothetical protein SOX26_08165 [Phocaeicola sp.]|nr:hypothetical protein [Phocaeicola sp.]